MREHLQNWYDAWLKERRSTDLLYVNRDGRGDPYLHQVHFVRDTLAGLLWRDVPYDQREKESSPRADCKVTAFVVGEHRSKSVRLPVYQLERPDLGLIVTLRDNYHDWNVSVSQETDGPDLTGFPDDSHYCFFQGFPADRQFGSRAENPRRFSLSLDREHDVYTLLWLLLRELRP